MENSWLNNDKACPLSLSLKLQLPVITSDAVTNHFDNLLPDNIAIRNRVIARYQTNSNQPFDLLKEIGKDSVGSIALLTPEQPYVNHELSYEYLSEERLEKILAAHNYDIPLGMIKEENFR
ncbi:HipA N-terminal domain-containing protein [Vibrio ezurae]|uniref:HipA N-terminal subdomain 1 domain-containing protein n=1 Tax=Vibrio ezurae NBRC 102218 TaxID=1219080 RepID=U3CKW2_9VIBR|nr:HipA N-terminal domain-containing protein [Vibrio ezurae]GAD78813.1 hypothetical protein VEZ01S_06_00040 [Vibrio ezurae NBRC 102218]